MFIRRKVVKGVTYYALVESYRKDGKVRQRILCSLGRESDLEVLIERAAEELADLKKPETCALAAMAGMKSFHLTAIIETEKRLEALKDWKAKFEKGRTVIPIATTEDVVPSSPENVDFATTDPDYQKRAKADLAASIKDKKLTPEDFAPAVKLYIPRSE